MRSIALIFLLVCGAMASHPNGVTRYQTITINSAQVAETNTHFLYQVKIPRGALVTSACTSSTNVVVYKSNSDTTKSPKWVVYTTDTLFLYADVAVSTSANSTYVIGYGLNVNAVNSASTFTNCGITNFWGADEESGTTAYDYADAKDGTVVSPASLGSKGLFGNAATFTGGSGVGANVITTSLSGNISVFSIDVTFRASSFANSGRIISAGGYPGTAGWTLYVGTNGAISLYCFTSWTSAPVASTNTNYHLLVTINNTTLNAYLNGTQIATNATIARTAPTASGVSIGNDTYGNGAKWNGWIDQPNITSDIKTAGYATTRYNMLFTPSTFSTLGAVAGVPVTPNPHIDTLQFVCSTSGATSYQWYIADTAVTGATDSVITIYADSAFYALKPTVYCMVSNGGELFVGFSWLFNSGNIINGILNKSKMYFRAGFH